MNIQRVTSLRVNLVKDKNTDPIADPHSIYNRCKKHLPLNEHGANGVMHTEAQS
jgi:hypothetical protein